MGFSGEGKQWAKEHQVKRTSPLISHLKPKLRKESTLTHSQEVIAELLKLECSDFWTTDVPLHHHFKKQLLSKFESAFVVGICQRAMASCSGDSC